MLEKEKEYQLKPWKLFHDNDSVMPVMKYGGASLACAEDIRKLAKVVEKDDIHFLVVSAMSGITSKLEKVAVFMISGQIQQADEIFEKDFLDFHKNICDELEISISDITAFVQASNFITMKKEGNMFGLDEKSFTNGLVAFGEIICVQIIKFYINRMKKIESFKFVHLDARQCIFVHDEENINYAATNERLVNKIHAHYGRRVIMEGFIAAEYKNLGRNGSDTTAALLALALLDVSGGIYPALTYFKEDIFQVEKDLKKYSLSYDDFVAAFKEDDQDYVHRPAVEILNKSGIPFRVICRNDENFQLFVSQKSVEFFTSEPWLSQNNQQVTV